MTPEEAFVQAVIESPDDDGPRLMYADWLEERGDPRGEFIRVQLELARLPEDDDRRAELAARERELLDTHHDSWAGPFRPALVDWEFRRGFLEWVWVSQDFLENLGEWREHVPPLFEMAPIREMRLLVGAPPVDLITGQPLSPVMPDGDLEWLARCPFLQRLSGLDVGTGAGGNGLDDITPGLVAVAASPHAAGLTSLNLWNRELTPDGFVGLATSPKLRRLCRLNLAGTGLDAESLAHITASSLGTRLTHLDCSQNDRLTGTTLRSLLGETGLKGLTHLTLGTEGLDEWGVQPLLGAPRLEQLVSLGVRYRPGGWHRENPDGRELVQAVPTLSSLLSLRSFVRLRELELEGLRLGPVGLEMFLHGSACHVVRSLALVRCGLEDGLMPSLQAVLNNGRLKRLDLRRNLLTDKGAVALSRCPGLARLHELDLRGNDLTPGGRAAIESSPHRHRWLHLLT